MKIIAKYVALSVVILVMSGFFLFYFFPAKIIALTNWSFASSAGLEKNMVSINGYTTHFYQSKVRNKKETLVLVHGLGDDKSSFLQAARLLSKEYNLVLPDLAGHGENARDLQRDYSIRGQANFLHQLLRELGVDSFVLAGNSMGGHTSLSYALNFPEEVKALILINAPGVTVDDHRVYTGFGKPLQSREDLNRVLGRVFYQVPDLPGPIADFMQESVNNGLYFVDQHLIPAITQGEDFDLKDSIINIKAPTLILWGKHDKVVKFNVAEYFHNTLQNNQLIVLEHGSHSPQLEIPDEVAGTIMHFINEAPH
jgi:abhydrolase domain-containing protein 6